MTTEQLLPPAATPPAGTRGSAPEEGSPEAMSGERTVERHLLALEPVLQALRLNIPRLNDWGMQLAERLQGGARLLAAGNGGSAAEAQHLTAELVGRFDGERPPFSAIALHADSSSLTAIGNDYGYDQVFARQVHGHARPGDIVLLLSTSGTSRNVILAAEAAREVGARSWALTGAGPNALSEACDESIMLPGPAANVQEAQLVAVHSICRAFDFAVNRARTEQSEATS